MMAAGEIARATGRWSEADRGRQDRLLGRLGIPAGVGDVPSDRILEYTKADKKRVDGRLRFILATRIGEVEIVDTIDEEDVRAAVTYIQDTC